MGVTSDPFVAVLKISYVRFEPQVKLSAVVRIQHLPEKCKGFFKSIHKMVPREMGTILYNVNK